MSRKINPEYILTEKEQADALIHWPVVYLLTDTTGGDPHGMFAELMGVSRNRAKTICYVMIYKHKSYMMGQWMKARRIGVAIAKELWEQDPPGSRTRSVVQIIDDAEDRVIKRWGNHI